MKISLLAFLIQKLAMCTIDWSGSFSSYLHSSSSNNCIIIIHTYVHSTRLAGTINPNQEFDPPDNNCQIWTGKCHVLYLHMRTHVRTRMSAANLKFPKLLVSLSDLLDRCSFWTGWSVWWEKSFDIVLCLMTPQGKNIDKKHFSKFLRARILYSE